MDLSPITLKFSDTTPKTPPAFFRVGTLGSTFRIVAGMLEAYGIGDTLSTVAIIRNEWPRARLRRSHSSALIRV